MKRDANIRRVGFSSLRAAPTSCVAAIPEPQITSTMHCEDEQLMADYADGDLGAFKTLYERYEKPLYQFAYNGCRNEADARELFQDIWLRVVRARRSFNPQHPFNAWLFTIARNRLTDAYRRQASHALNTRLDDTLHSNADATTVDQASAHTDWWTPSLTPEQIASASQQSSTLQSVLLKLPEHQREAVLLKHIAGMNLKEIAAVQAEGVETVKSRLRYAMVKLRQYLKELS